MKSSPRQPQLEKAMHSNEDLTQPKIRINKWINLYKRETKRTLKRKQRKRNQNRKLNIIESEEKKKSMILRELRVGKLGRGFTICPIQKIPSVGEEQLELSHTTDTSVNGTCTVWQYQSWAYVYFLHQQFFSQVYAQKKEECTCAHHKYMDRNVYCSTIYCNLKLSLLLFLVAKSCLTLLRPYGL